MSVLRPWVSDQGPAKRAYAIAGMDFLNFIIEFLNFLVGEIVFLHLQHAVPRLQHRDVLLHLYLDVGVGVDVVADLAGVVQVHAADLWGGQS